MKRNSLVSKKNLPYVMPKERSINIDSFDDLINSRVINEEIFFEKKYINKIAKEHSVGKKNWDNSLWAILIFIQWYNANY